MAIPPTLINRFNQIRIRIPAAIFAEIDKPILKGPGVAITILKKNRGGPTLLNFSTHYKASLIKTVLVLTQGQTYRSVKQNSGSRNKPIYISMVNWCLTRVPRHFDGERTVFSTNGAGAAGQPPETEWSSTLTSRHKQKLMQSGSKTKIL